MKTGFIRSGSRMPCRWLPSSTVRHAGPTHKYSRSTLFPLNLRSVKFQQLRHYSQVTRHCTRLAAFALRCTRVAEVARLNWTTPIRSSGSEGSSAGSPREEAPDRFFILPRPAFGLLG